MAQGIDPYSAEAKRLLDEDEEYRQRLARFAAAVAATRQQQQPEEAPGDQEQAGGINPYEFVKQKLASVEGMPLTALATEAWKLFRFNPMKQPARLTKLLLGDAEPEYDLQGLITGRKRELSLAQKVKNFMINTEAAVDRGVYDAVDNIENTLGGIAAWAFKESGLYKLFKDDKEEQEFLEWYKQPTKDWDVEWFGIPVMASRSTMEQFMPPEQTGAYGFIEEVSQFATSWVAGGAFLKMVGAVPMIGAPLQALDKTRLLRGGVQGALADLSGFDPYEERLSNFIADGPEWFGQPALKYIAEPLKSKKEDGEATARLKQALEGFLTGKVMEVVIFGIKRLRIKKLFQEQSIDEKKAAEELEELRKEFSHLFDESTEVADGPARVVQDADGMHNVEVDIPEFDLRWSDEAPTVGPNDVHAAPDGSPRKLDFDHVKSTPEEINPDILTVGLDADGNYVVRAIETGAEGQPHKVVEVPFDEEAIRQLKEKNPNVSVHTPLVNNNMTDEQWAAWRKAAFKGPESKGTAAVEEVTSAATPKAKEKAKAKAKVVESRNVKRSKAEVEASTFNIAAKNIEEAGNLFVDEKARKAFVEAFKAYARNGDAREAAELLEQYGFNASYIQEPKQAIDAIKSLVDNMGEAMAIARGRVLTNEEALEEAIKLFPEIADKGAAKFAAELFGGVQRLPQALAAARMWMHWQARQVAKLTKLADAFPDNAKIVDQQMAALNTLFQVHAYVTGAITKTAQGLQSMQMKGISENVAKVGAAVKRAEARAAAETVAGKTEVSKTAKAVGNDKETIAGKTKVVRGSDKETVAAKTQAARGSDAETKVVKRKPTVAERLAQAVADGKLTHRAPGTYDIAKSMTREEIKALSRLIGMADGNLEGMLKLINGPRHADLAAAKSVPTEVKRNWFRFVNTYRTEALLSAFSTQLGNIVSNLGVAIKRPGQYIWAGIESGDSALAREGVDMMTGLFWHMAESAKLAAVAFKQGRNVLDEVGKTYEAMDDLLPLEAAAMQNGNLVGNLASTLFRMPSRFLLTADEFFKQLNYRSYLRAQVLRASREAGVTDPRLLKERVDAALRVAFDPQGGGIYPEALKYAREVTFTDDLPKRVQEWQTAIHNSELGRFIVPFFRTPVNIFMHAWEEAPLLNMLNKRMMDDLAAGGRRAAIARAKADFGAVVWGIGAWLVLTGKVTGMGPSDPELRKQWIAAGNQPYSIIFGEGKDAVQVSYRRGDPFTTGLGMIADWVTISGELDEQQKMSLAAAVISTFANNVTNKTFMQGLSDFLDAVGSGQVKDAQSFVGNALASFVPNILVRGNPDDTMREARTLLDNVIARLPGMSETVEPRRNIFGEKVMKAPGWSNRFFNPFTKMGPPDELQAELLELGKAMPMPNTKWGHIDLTDRETFGPDRNGQSPYDRMLEMMSDPPWGGPSLREYITEVMKNDDVKKLPDKSLYAPGGTKHDFIARIIDGYQQMARGYLLREYPTLRAAVQQQHSAEAAALMGGPVAAEEVLKKYEQLFIQQPR